MSCWLWALFLALPVASADGATRPQRERTVSLEFHVPTTVEGCPRPDDVRRAVAARLGYVPFRPQSATVVIAHIKRNGRGLRGFVALRRRDGTLAGQRQLASSTGDCRELAAALELAVSIAIDPLILLRPSPRNQGPTRQKAPHTAPSNNSRPFRHQRDGRPGLGPPRFEFGSGLLVGVGVLPHPNLGLTLHASLDWQRFSLVLQGRADLPASKSIGSGRVEASLYSGSLAPCLKRDPLLLCGVVAFGALRGRGVDLLESAQDTTLFAGVGVRGGVRWHLGRRWVINLQLEPIAALSRTTLRVNQRELWTTPPLSLSIGGTLGCSL
ncbi:MAG: hypothetical protein H6707_06895 [Deltaproteobacteria bacterium]|nr:hypothetical protein [Deltaproteobacteria bacterium]